MKKIFLLLIKKKLLPTLIFSNIRVLTLSFILFWKNYFLQKFRETIHEIVSMLKVPLLEMNTQRKFGKIWFENILRNSKLLFENNYSYEPININKKAVLITGSGYSLYENIDLIKKESENLFIASTDTSLKVLSKFNIIPHLCFHLIRSITPIFNFQE